MNSKALLLFLAAACTLPGGPIQLSVNINNATIDGGIVFGQLRSDLGFDDTFYFNEVTSGLQTTFQLIGSHASATLDADLVVNCNFSQATCDPSFHSARTLSMRVDDSIGVYLGVYTADVSYDLSFIASTALPLLQELYCDQPYVYGCPSYHTGYLSQGGVSYTVTGTESWTRPDGTVVQLTVLPSNINGFWRYWTEYGGELDLVQTYVPAPVTTPEPATGLLIGFGLATVFRIRLFRRLIRDFSSRKYL